jgi:hypothetical protein
VHVGDCVAVALNKAMGLNASYQLQPQQELDMQLNKLIALRQTVLSVSLGIGAMISAASALAESPDAIAAKVENTVTSASGVQVKPGKLPKQGKTTAGAMSGKNGNNQYPGTAPIPLPKPKKDALEAAGALKSKAAQ